MPLGARLRSFGFIYKYSFLAYRDLHGRTGRLYFWCYQIIYGLLLLGLVLTRGWGLLLMALATLVFLPSLVAIHVRRLRDVGHSGWMILPKFFYVPLLVWVLRIMLEQGVSFDALFLATAAAQQPGVAVVDNMLQHFMVLGAVYSSLVYETILLCCYLAPSIADTNNSTMQPYRVRKQ